MWPFSSCGKWGPLFIAVHGLLIEVASLVAEHRLSVHGGQSLGLVGCRVQAQYLWHIDLVAPQLVGIFLVQGWNLCPLHCKVDS